MAAARGPPMTAADTAIPLFTILDRGVHDPDLGVHDGAISVFTTAIPPFTMVRSGCSRHSEIRTWIFVPMVLGALSHSLCGSVSV